MIGRAPTPSGESPLDARLCAEIGAALLQVRVSRGLSTAQVGEKLLLSTRQVKALEDVEFAAFYNPTFFVNALKKYASFAELDPALAVTIASALAKPEPGVVAFAASAAVQPKEDRSGRRPLVAVLALLLAGGALAAGYVTWQRGSAAPAANAIVASPPASPQQPPPPAQPPAPREPAVVPENLPAAPLADAVVQHTPAMFGSLRVLHPAWMFVRDADGVVTERSLKAGESFEFETQPTYLAVGTTAAELMIGDAAIDVLRFAANGQIRVRAGDFDALVQGASPIQAPTAAAAR
ncbi:MAG TPA: RodZ domain-containing protein [Vicinamibacterales bacterium]|nr:RodZ domain-containing protein [Vicinamibacterales bacterium]